MVPGRGLQSSSLLKVGWPLMSVAIWLRLPSCPGSARSAKHAITCGAMQHRVGRTPECSAC